MNPEIRQKLKESLPEEIRRLIYPMDYPTAEAMESIPEKEPTPMNAARAILKQRKHKNRKKMGAVQRRKLRGPSNLALAKEIENEQTEEDEEESGGQIWWKDEAIMRQILADPECYPPPEGFPLNLLSKESTAPLPDTNITHAF